MKSVFEKVVGFIVALIMLWVLFLFLGWVWDYKGTIFLILIGIIVIGFVVIILSNKDTKLADKTEEVIDADNQKVPTPDTKANEIIIEPVIEVVENISEYIITTDLNRKPMSINNHVILTEFEAIEEIIIEQGKKRYEEDINKFFEKKSLGVAGYIEQLEKNTPYNQLLYTFTNSMVVSYFHVYSDRSGNETYETLAIQAQKDASKEAPAVIEYIKTGVGIDNPLCQNFEPLRNISIKNPKDYVEELEFSLSCYKSRYIVSDLFLYIMSSPNNEAFRKYFAENLTTDQIYDLIEARFKILGNKIIGNHKEVVYRVDH